MNSLGGLIFLVIIVVQVIAAIGAHLKKQRDIAAKTARKLGESASQPPTPAEPSPRSIAAKRQAMLARRRAQLEELRAQRTPGATEAGEARVTRPTKPARAAAPPPPPATPVIIIPEERPAMQVDDTASVHDTESAYKGTKARRSRLRGSRSRELARLLRDRTNLRQAVLLKELIDPPVALRTPGQDSP